MKCYINRVITDKDLQSDIKSLIPDAGLRRRMSRIIKSAVSVAVECIEGVNNIDSLDAIITATGWGCLTDSERFLTNIIKDKEQLLNPTPFIQSTFNTVGGQIALLRHNHCYNVTYVNRSHSFEDALLDAMMRISDNDSNNIIVGAFDEKTPSQHIIMERMGLFRKYNNGEGVVFAHITAEPRKESIAILDLIDFPKQTMTEEKCLKLYGTTENSQMLYNAAYQYGIFPTASAHCFAEAVKLVQEQHKEVIVYNDFLGGAPVVLRVKCIG